MEYLQYVPHILFLPVSHPRLSSFAPDLAATCMLYPQLTKSITINSTSSQIQKASQDCSLQRFQSVWVFFPIHLGKRYDLSNWILREVMAETARHLWS